MFPENIQLPDLLTFFLFIDLIVMAVVGIIMYKTRHKKGKTEQLLEEIRDALTQNPNGCSENLTNKSKTELAKNPSFASHGVWPTDSSEPQKEVMEIKQEAVKENPPEKKPNQQVPISPIDRERIYYEIEESTEPSNDESSDLNLVKNALKQGAVIKPLLKMPKYIDEVVNRSRHSESSPEQKEVATTADSTVLPPPPPPTQQKQPIPKRMKKRKSSNS